MGKQQKDETASLPNWCHRCGSRFSDDEMFCTSCGRNRSNNYPIQQDEESEDNTIYLSIYDEKITLDNSDGVGKEIRRVLINNGISISLARYVDTEQIGIKQEEDDIYIRDENSTNGTKLNGERIDDEEGPGEYHLATQGDKISFAEVAEATVHKR